MKITESKITDLEILGKLSLDFKSLKKSNPFKNTLPKNNQDLFLTSLKGFINSIDGGTRPMFYASFSTTSFAVENLRMCATYFTN